MDCKFELNKNFRFFWKFYNFFDIWQMRLMTFATVLSIRQLTFFLAVSEFPWYQNYFSIQSTNFSLAYIWSYIYWSALSKIWLYCTQNIFSLYRRLLWKICTLIASIDGIKIAWLCIKEQIVACKRYLTWSE